MTLRALELALVLAVSACICVVYEQSAFERDCQARGGNVRTFSATQACVTDAGTSSPPAPARGVDADDAGTD